MFNIGDRVYLAINGSGYNIPLDTPGTVVKVDPDDSILSCVVSFDCTVEDSFSLRHDTIKNCVWCTDSVEYADSQLYVISYIENTPSAVNDYTRSCWYCRPGGMVDTFAKLTGVNVLCPVCNRVCYGMEE